MTLGLLACSERACLEHACRAMALGRSGVPSVVHEASPGWRCLSGRAGPCGEGHVLRREKEHVRNQNKCRWQNAGRGPESQRRRFPPPALGARTTGVKLITFPLLVTPPTVPSTGAQIKCQHSLSPWPFLRTLAQGNRISSRDAKGKGC